MRSVAFQNEIKSAIDALGIERVVELCAVSQSTVYRWASGESQPVKLMMRFAVDILKRAKRKEK